MLLLRFSVLHDWESFDRDLYFVLNKGFFPVQGVQTSQTQRRWSVRSQLSLSVCYKALLREWPFSLFFTFICFLIWLQHVLRVWLKIILTFQIKQQWFEDYPVSADFFFHLLFSLSFQLVCSVLTDKQWMYCRCCEDEDSSEDYFPSTTVCCTYQFKMQGPEQILPWMKALVNHFWYCCNQAISEEQF